ncbi:hypothetical protein J3R80_03055 [Aliiroseovarius sp. Z3]|uniref:hypothetical protein n=1 Tax=Aliiroseovarius sp. Z3 TaxID=2811402 RepID=UPI0023B30408|nr:hypothetical protein [Aliiroseovarius sp. Z3]MDE9449444.1 hypothetical protein [Aliiroseovarius sp. Z3]
MERDALAPVIIGAVVVLAIAAGLTITGGPTSARAEKRDLARLADLRVLASFARCVADITGSAPTKLAPMGDCGTDLPLTDRTTDAPYRYEALTAKGFLLCADFERPGLITNFDIAGAVWQHDQGCFAFTQP